MCRVLQEPSNGNNPPPAMMQMIHSTRSRGFQASIAAEGTSNLKCFVKRIKVVKVKVQECIMLLFKPFYSVHVFGKEDD